MNEPRKFTAVASKTHSEIAGDLAAAIKALIYEQSDKLPLALVVGVLRIVEYEILNDATQP